MPDNAAARGENDEELPPPLVLVVDDVQANLVAMDALLQEMDCNVVLASSGNAALRELLRQEFAVILLDVQMPNMDGYEVASHVRSNPATRDVAIIFLTAARGDEDTALRAYGTGAVDFLLKPFNPNILRSKVSVFLALARERARLAAAKARLEQANSELGRAYRQLQETQSQLVQSAKMASLGQLVAGVAHEINNPLAFSRSHLDTAQKCLGQVEKKCPTVLGIDSLEYWERAKNRMSEMDLGLERIADLVIKLRTFSRLDEGEFMLVSVSESIQALLTIVRHRLGSNIMLRTAFGAPDTLECFSALINQAVMNLVVNAIDAVQGRGQITITTGRRADSYEIVVADSGVGVPDALKDRVFEPFFTTKEIGEGTGLGLSLAYSIVKKHGGTLSLENLNPGTNAIIRIPLGRG